MEQRIRGYLGSSYLHTFGIAVTIFLFFLTPRLKLPFAIIAIVLLTLWLICQSVFLTFTIQRLHDIWRESEYARKIPTAARTALKARLLITVLILLALLALLPAPMPTRLQTGALVAGCITAIILLLFWRSRLYRQIDRYLHRTEESL